MINLQSPGPIGLGELLNLPDGNSILVLKDKDGNSVSHKLWINDFTSDLNMEIDTVQLKQGYTYRPIRIQERTLTFTTIWSLANRPKYEALVEAIRTHWAYNLNELVPTPAYFTYFGANKTFVGFILNAERSYAVPDTLLSYSFDMKLMSSSKINENLSEVSIYSYYIPRPENIKVNGIDGWYAVSDLVNSPKPEPATVIYDNLVQQREGGVYSSGSSVYVKPDYPEYTDLVTAEEDISVPYTNREVAAALIYYYIVKNNMNQADAIELARRTLKNPDPDNREWIWQQVKNQDWTPYLDLV